MARDQDGRDWLFLLRTTLERVGVPVVACRAVTGQALLVLDPERVLGNPKRITSGVWPENVLRVSIDREKKNGYRQIGDLRVGYERIGELPKDSRRALDVVARFIEKLAPKISALRELESSYVLGTEHLEPHQAIAFAFPFCTAERAKGQGSGTPKIREVLVRVTGRCNQQCSFCSAPRPGGDPQLETLERLFVLLDRKAPEATVTLTGGEPTLRVDLPRILELALGGVQGSREVEVQTNAVRFAKKERLADLPHTKQLRFFVSLHSMESTVYDEMTGTKGMLEHALQGIEWLLQLGHKVILSVVATQWNAGNERDLVQWVEAVAARFKLRAPSLLALHFSITLCPEHRPEAVSSLVRYSDLARVLEKAFERAQELELSPEPLLSSSHAAIPACFLSEKYRIEIARGMNILEPIVVTANDSEPGWHKAARCFQCSVFGACHGLPLGYVRRFGDSEVEPI